MTTTPEAVQNPVEAASDPAESESIDTGSPEIETYAAAIEAYLLEATWLTAADAIYKVHARKIAQSLDQQVAKDGGVQSALASTFGKVLESLEKRRPGPPAPDPLRDAVGPHGEQSIFGAQFE